MTTPSPVPRQAPASPPLPLSAPQPLRAAAHPLVFAMVALLMLLGVALGLVFGRWSRPEPDGTATVLRPSRSVVVAVRDLARLESAEYHIERVIDLKEKQSRFMGLVNAQDAILLVASGTVIAGVDLSKLAEQDIRVDTQRNTARVKLPAPQILSAALDNERTYVHTRETDLLARRQESLESRARLEAAKSIVEAAKEAGIMTRARSNSAQTVKSLVRSLGYEHVEVTFSD